MTAFLTQKTAPETFQDVLALQAVFETLDESSCPLHYNFHLHTRASDGQLQPEILAEQAIKIGLQGFAVTDHHTMEGFYRVQGYFEQLQHSDCAALLPQLWTGIEVTADLLNTDVHILGYAFNPQHPSLAAYVQGHRPYESHNHASQVIDAIHQAGGLAVLAHPARYRRSADELIPAIAQLGIDGVETFYAYDNPDPWETSIRQTREIQDLAQTYQLLSTCGTDTHGLTILQRL